MRGLVIAALVLAILWVLVVVSLVGDVASFPA
ncbi:MAG: hypothetical protein QOD86_2217 [Miltoncostaeaceae bacterium]|jgi:hypothetical protein|nr:hypothetical protein [Miltoncostaeaceae bacterium]